MSSSSRPAGGFDPQRLIETHQAGVWRYLRALGCDAAQADDLTQDTFLRVLQQPFQDYSRAATAAYLRRAAFNLFVSAQRRSGRVVAVEELEAIDNSWARLAAEENGEEMLKSLRECLEQLSQRARSALDMRYRDEELITGFAGIGTRGRERKSPLNCPLARMAPKTSSSGPKSDSANASKVNSHDP